MENTYISPLKEKHRLPDNVIFEVSTITSLNSIKKDYFVRFNQIDSTELLQSLIDLTNLFFKIINKSTPSEELPILKSHFNQRISKFTDNYDQKCYFLGNELRKTEFIDNNTSKTLLLIKQNGVYLPEDFVTYHNEIF